MSRRSESSRLRGVWRNGIILMTGAALLTKLIGALQKVPLQNLAGDRVFGIYNAVYPFYQLIAVLATAGIPTALSILIAHRLRDEHAADGTRATVTAALLLLGLSGGAAFVLMWVTADVTASWIGDESAALAIRVLSAALLFAPIVAVLRGYEQGKNRMGLSAASQVAEQLVRVAMMLLALEIGLMAGWSDARLAAGVMSGSAAGAAVAALLLAIRGWSGRAGSGSGLTLGRLFMEMKSLVAFAGPAALASIVVPVTGVVDSFMVPRLLRESGMAEETAMSLFGVYSRGGPLVQLVTMVAGAAAAAIVPALAAAKANGEAQTLELRLSMQLRAAWLTGGAAAIGLVLLAEPLNVMLYKDAKGTLAFALIGCTALAGCVSAVVTPALQALGSARASVALLLLAALLKGALNAALVPSLGIEGAALSGVAALTAAAMLGAAALRRAAKGLRPPQGHRRQRGRGLAPAAAGAAALAIMAASVLLAERALDAALGHELPPRAKAAALALTGAAVGAMVFALAALRAGAIDAREWRAIPGGEAWAARLRRWRLIPPAD
ncbi:polysaccharide biosynthesis protein [Paenibacillus nanensis]|uniref:Polysaccharide biosynthesis protein n=1 Tax=Paenibacillus nanensis TaxID=393251 RepID=A0A3A1UWJ9_9BACL|nr:oligosaccharide flippase family protein [Paenibacillus nanensis]RIX49271.1 polysaccharide biosynthesis protein [Paenibacillus nanensis]